MLKFVILCLEIDLILQPKYSLKRELKTLHRKIKLHRACSVFYVCIYKTHTRNAQIPKYINVQIKYINVQSTYALGP